MEKIVILGYKGSGKTTYLAGMYYEMTFGVGDFNLSTNPTTDLLLDGYWNGINSGNPPLPSNEVEEFEFSLLYNMGNMIDFVWKDYPGGIIAANGGQDRENLISDLADAKSVIVIVNGDVFKGKSINDLRNMKQIRDNDLRQLFGFLDYAATKCELPPVNIVVTKADYLPDHPDTLKLLDYIMFNSFKFFKPNMNKNERLVLITPVSLGGEFGDGKPLNGDLLNIEQPIIFTVLNIYVDIYFQLSNSYNNIQNAMNNRGFWSRVFNPGAGIVYENKLDKIKESLNYVKENLDIMLDVFSNNDIIYVNGIQQNLKQYYRGKFNIN